MERIESMEVLRTGTHTASNGVKVTFDREDLARIAASYDPAFHESPAVIGHPEQNKPAYGWVKALRAVGEKLLATVDLVPEFAEAIRQGLFKKRSASIYPDLDGKGPYLRHIGFLGSMPPAVKALADISGFGEDDKQSLSFEFTETEKEKSMSWKDRAKQFFTKAIDEIPEAGAGAVAPVVHVMQPAASDKLATSFSEDDVRKREEAAAKKAKDEAALEFAEQTRKAEVDRKAGTHKADVKAKIDAMVSSKDGKITPAMVKAGLVEFAQSLPFADDQTFEFSEGGKQVKKTPCDWLLETFLPLLPKQIHFGEYATRDKDVSGDPADRREKVINDFMEHNPKASYKDAVLEVSAKHPELFRNAG